MDYWMSASGMNANSALACDVLEIYPETYLNSGAYRISIRNITAYFYTLEDTYTAELSVF